jgi:hypothetical protein
MTGITARMTDDATLDQIKEAWQQLRARDDWPSIAHRLIDGERWFVAIMPTIASMANFDMDDTTPIELRKIEFRVEVIHDRFDPGVRILICRGNDRVVEAVIVRDGR